MKEAFAGQAVTVTKRNGAAKQVQLGDKVGEGFNIFVGVELTELRRPW